MESNTIESLVKYDEPQIVSTSITKKNQKGKKQAPMNAQEKTQKDKEKRDQAYLDSILPPREFTRQGNLHVSYVSPKPATEVDVITLQNDLDNLITTKMVRETGICSKREELYAQCFDELIRQITINCAERGFLLVRVRDEQKMNIQAYQTLYESSIAYGMRKALMAEHYKSEMENQIKALEKENEEFEQQIKDMEQEIENMIKDEEDKFIDEKNVHDQEVQHLTELNEDYQKELKQLLSESQK